MNRSTRPILALLALLAMPLGLQAGAAGRAEPTEGYPRAEGASTAPANPPQRQASIFASCFCADATWQARADVPAGVEGAAGAVVGDKIYALKTRTLRIFDIVGDSWTTGASSPSSRDEGAGVAVGTKLYVMGGRSSRTALSTSVESYDTTTNTWATLADMPTPRGGPGVTAVDGLIHVIGGRTDTDPHSGSPLTTHEVYDPALNSWATAADLPTAMGDVYATIAYDDRIYVFGGWTGSGVSNLTQIYDVATDSWSSGATMPTARSNAIAGLLDGRLVVIGGVDTDRLVVGSRLADVEVYDPATDTWCIGPAKPNAASELVAGPLFTGDAVYAIGSGALGFDGTFNEVLALDDTTPPTTSCPTDITLECPADPVDVDEWLATVTATDACDQAPTVTSTLIDHQDDCGATYTDIYEFTATDANGNSATCTATIAVIDTAVPTFTDVPADATVPCDDIPVRVDPIVGDGCDADPSLAYAEVRTDGSCADSYTLTRTWTATDACGNVATATQTITVQDNVAPVLADVPGDVTVECDAVPVAAVATASDNCDPAPTIAYAEVRTDGSCPDSYTLTRTWTATDRCGNVATATQTITVQDSVAPVLAGVPGNVTAECDAVPVAAVATAGDNCDAAPTIAYTETRTDGSCADNYTLTRVWTATDRCGNTSVGTQLVTVVDTTAPVPVAVLAPALPMPPASPVSAAAPGSVCSAPTSRSFEVVCAATDNCDPSPAVTARILVSWHEVASEHAPCVLQVEAIDVACGEIVDLHLVPPPCPAKPPKDPQPPLTVDSRGRKVITAEAVVLEVTATDQCGNTATAGFDPTVEPSPTCDEQLADGTCCPALGLPATPGCDEDPCPLERPLLSPQHR